MDSIISINWWFVVCASRFVVLGRSAAKKNIERGRGGRGNVDLERLNGSPLQNLQKKQKIKKSESS